jgi:putative FmdB family regulatory protein
MPIYEYRCDTCEAVIEKRQKFSEALLTECETCGGVLQKLISAPGLQFKGTGWYVTDYAGKGKAPNGKSAAPESPKSETNGQNKSKTKTGSDTKKATSTVASTSKKD